LKPNTEGDKAASEGMHPTQKKKATVCGVVTGVTRTETVERANEVTTEKKKSRMTQCHDWIRNVPQCPMCAELGPELVALLGSMGWTEGGA
jgi:hypothetical protein